MQGRIKWVEGRTFVAESGSGHGLVIDEDPPPVRWANIASALITPVWFLASIPVAYLVNAEAAKYMWLLLIVIGPLSGRLAPGVAYWVSSTRNHGQRSRK